MPSFAIDSRPRRVRRGDPDFQMIEVTRSILEDVLITCLDDRVELAEVAASTACIGWYISSFYGGSEAQEEYGSPIVPALRCIEQFGPRTGITPNQMAICAGALTRLSASAEAQAAAQRIIDAADAQPAGSPLVWPRWRHLPLVTAHRAWIEDDVDIDPPMLVTSWLDADRREHSVAVTGYGACAPRRSVGSAVHSIVLGDAAAVTMQTFATPSGDEPPIAFREISLAEARNRLDAMIDDVAIAADHLPPADIVFAQLAFLEHRRDLLPDE